MINKNRFQLVSLLLTPSIVPGSITNGEEIELDFFKGSKGWSINDHQMAFAFDNNSIIKNMDLVINTSTLKIHDLNDNDFPDTGELSIVLGTLYSPETLDELGSYRASFIWGILDNSTDGVPVSVGTQVFDIRDNGTIVVIGDVITDSRIGSGPGNPFPVTSVVAGGTERYHGVSGSVAITEKFYDPGKALFLDVVFDLIPTNRPS